MSDWPSNKISKKDKYVVTMGNWRNNKRKNDTFVITMRDGRLNKRLREKKPLVVTMRDI